MSRQPQTYPHYCVVPLSAAVIWLQWQIKAHSAVRVKSKSGVTCVFRMLLSCSRADEELQACAATM